MEKDNLVALVLKAQSGDNQALNNLFTETYNDVYYFALKTVKNETLAADITQDTFVSVFQNIASLTDPVAYPAWSRQITYRLCLQHLKKQNREVIIDENEDGSTLFDTLEEDRTEFIPGAELDKEDFKKTILKIVDGLPEEQRTAIILYYYDELSVKEIAEIQGVSGGTVKSRLNYGRKAIKLSVEEYEKKNNVKLHCTGVLPLLLWLFASDASACAMTASTAGAVTSGVSAATGTVLSATSFVKHGAKAAWTLWQKIVAGLAATAVAVGGTVAAVNLLNKPEPIAETVPAPTEPEVQIWSGKGSINVGLNLSDENQFVLEIEEMDETHIKGKITVTPVGSSSYQRNFEGDGRTIADEKIFYTVQLDEPVEGYTVLGDLEFSGFSKMEIQYVPEDDQFILGVLFTSQPYYAFLDKENNSEK